MSDERKLIKEDATREQQPSDKPMGFFEKYVPHSHVSNAIATIFLVGVWGMGRH
jgi:hypothetical protein